MMASRYGRKKRRKHLERIAALERFRQYDIDALLEARKERADAREQLQLFQQRVERWNEHLRDLLGAHTALSFEPLEHNPRMPLNEVRHAQITPPVSIGRGGAETIPAKLSHQIEKLIQIVGGVDRDPMADRRLVHMTLVNGNVPHIVNGRVVDWNYSISEATLQNGLTEHQIVHIAEQIALKFVERMRIELGRKAA